MKASTFFTGLITGLAAGAAATIFSTPQSGQELRTSLKSNSDDWKEKFADVKEQLNGLKDSVNNLKLESKSQGPAAIDGLKQSLQDWQESTAPAKEHLQLEIMAIQNAIEELQNSISKDQKNSDVSEAKDNQQEDSETKE